MDAQRARRLVNGSISGRLLWVVAAWCAVFGLFYIAAGDIVLAALMAFAVPVVLGKVLGWSWAYLALPFVESNKPGRNCPAMALHASFWFGWAVLVPFDVKDASEPGLLTEIRYCWMGSLAIMAGILWMLAIGEWLTHRLVTSDKVDDDALRHRRIRALIVFIAYALGTITSIDHGYDTPRLVRVTIPMAGLPECLSGYTVAMLTDLHGGPVVGRTNVQQYVDQLNALNADAQLLVGDMADGPPADRGDELAPVSQLDAPDGVYYVTGNHEYMHGSSGKDWLRWMARQPSVTVLNNTGVTLPVRFRRPDGGFRFPDCQDSDTFDLLGVVDKTACLHDQSLCEKGRVNLAKAAAKAKLDPDQAAQLGTPARASLLLAHQPLDADSAAEAGITAQVAGHTHGGQIWPIHWSTYLGNKGRVAGGFSISRAHQATTTPDMHLYVSTYVAYRYLNSARLPLSDVTIVSQVGEGAVGWGPRLRLWSNSEITLLTLVPATAHADTITTDSRHPSQTGGLVGSVLIITSIACACVSMLANGYRRLRENQQVSSVTTNPTANETKAESSADENIP